MALRNLPNAELTRLYDSDLVLKLRNPKNLRDTRTILSHFMGYLGAYPPSPELAKGFLAQYADRKPHTLYRYTQMIRSFMKWYHSLSTLKKALFGDYTYEMSCLQKFNDSR